MLICYLKFLHSTVQKRNKNWGPRVLKICHCITLVLQDNASTHKVKGVIEYVERIGMKTLEHPPYSPDLSTCDIWLFDKLKNHLSGKDF